MLERLCCSLEGLSTRVQCLLKRLRGETALFILDATHFASALGLRVGLVAPAQYFYFDKAEERGNLLVDSIARWRRGAALDWILLGIYSAGGTGQVSMHGWLIPSAVRHLLPSSICSWHEWSSVSTSWKTGDPLVRLLIGKAIEIT